MVYTFVAGVVAGAAMMKYYGTTESESEEKKTGATESRSTALNRSLGYHAEADITNATHVNFLSDVVARLWPYMSQAIAETARASVEPSFKETLPGPLTSLKFTRLDLGDVPIVIDNILVRELRKIDDKSHTYGTNKHYLQFEWDIVWQSECDIRLATDKLAGISAIAFGVKGIKLAGRMQVICKPLSTSLPCVDAVQAGFVNPPEIELDFTGLANIADMKLGNVKGAVRDIVNDILAASLVLPTRIAVPLLDNVDFRDMFVPQYKGMARIRLHSGRGFQVQKATRPFGKDDVPDVYIKMRVGVEEYYKSSVCKDNCNPEWDCEENYHDFLVCQYRDQILEIQAWDEDTGTLEKDDYLGIAHVTLGQAMLNADRDGLFEVELMEDGGHGKNQKPTGQFITISMEKIPFTTTNLSSLNESALEMDHFQKKDLEGMEEKQREKQEKKFESKVVGLATIIVSHATNVPVSKVEEANTLVKVYMGAGHDKKEIGTTAVIAGMMNPQYMHPISIPLTVASQKEWYKSVGNQCFSFEMFQQNAKTFANKSLGEVIVDHTDLEAGDEWAIRDERPVGKHSRTMLAFSISYAGVDSSTNPRRSSVARSSVSKLFRGSLGDLPSEEDDIELVEAPPKVRVQLVKGYGFKSEKKGPFRKLDVPDVYCMIKYGSSPQPWRTKTIKDSETPTWTDEYKDFPMESMNEVISVAVYDANSKGADDYYGSARTSVANVLLNNGKLDIEVKYDGHGDPDRKNSGQSNIFVTLECTKM